MSNKDEKQKVRSEKRASFFYDLSKMFLAGSGVSGFSPLLFNTENEVNWYSIALGIMLSLFFAVLADKTLKQ